MRGGACCSPLEHAISAGAREQGASHGRLGVEKRRTIGAGAAVDQDHQAYSWSEIKAKWLQPDCSTLEKLLFAVRAPGSR